MNTLLKTIAAASVALTVTSVAQAETFNFGIISTESQQNQRPKWEPFLADLEAATGLDVEPFFATDYAGVIEGMRFGKVQMAWYGNKSAMEAVDRAEGEVFVQTVSAEGNPGYWSLILAHAVSINAFDGRSHALDAAPVVCGEAEPPAEAGLVMGMYDHLERELDEGGFFHPIEKRPSMVRNLRVMLGRARFTEQEVATFRGVIHALSKGRGRVLAKLAGKTD